MTQVSRLIDHLIQCDDARYDDFCAALNETDQRHIVDEFLKENSTGGSSEFN